MATKKATYPLFDLKAEIASKRESGKRYTTEEKDMSLYEFIMAGNKFHEYHGLNIPGISRSTLGRHLRANTEEIREGEECDERFNVKQLIY